MLDTPPPEQSRDYADTQYTGRSLIDTATGAVMATRHLDRRRAFAEMAGVSRRRHVSLMALARGVLAVVSDREPPDRNAGQAATELLDTQQHERPLVTR
ncbi:ANTAR domain-containing protein [Rhodococcus sp. HNM0569]|uniref:ANTAR domain-containing protein n=1 Tax=Rhodococcus sp. HNM0569 TaxID=2716340 RepID=UPI00146C4E6E|nr:ANTAR domain-containing protein [Rhodococcus sp. HNM0569]NLU85105.1 ANTAR domain-containing protein [Rhodococcus sp. HNM0569]